MCVFVYVVKYSSRAADVERERREREWEKESAFGAKLIGFCKFVFMLFFLDYAHY